MFKAGDYLDAQEERKVAIEFIKNRILELEYKKYDLDCHWQDIHGEEYHKERENYAKYNDEIIFRLQDLDVFLYDFKKDWDLNFGYDEIRKD